VEHTYNIVRNIPFAHTLKNVPFFSASHHEFLDGTGYPRRLTSDELPPQARILAVADIFDALTAVDRPYRSAIPPSKACQVLKAHAKAGRLDQDIVNLFTEKALYNKT
jgi:HD-GYP domain-containing protein (c-di-GMP phosphodiesterase class II)